MSVQDQHTQSLQEEQAIYDEFVRAHPKSRLEYKGQPLEYVACGHGSHTMLIPPHISSLFPSEMGYRHILGFESQFRIIAPSLIESDSLDEIAASLLCVMKKEGTGPVILFGQSGSGITAQVFFRRYSRHVAGMVLINTVAPGHPAPRTPLFTLFKLLPTALLKVIFKKELMKPLDSASLPPELAAKVQMSRALLNECFEARFSKRRLAIEMRNALKFNAEGFVDPKLLKDWQGRVLIVTSEDDAGFADSRLLSEKLPNASLLVLEKGYGHLAPAMKSQEVRSAIDRLMSSLSQ
ncbi:MAG TPA: alpha/beta hydrolase [Anaerolineae bacterium]|nr:alpha/beta hydrolase [Anaerolineae bacterium]